MMILTLLISFLSLIALMIIHEFGHFIIAKKFGVKVEEFGIGYPPRLFGKKFGETLYSINLIPLGAFVKIFGEEGDVHDAKSFSNLAIWKRILIVLGGVLAFWIASIIIFSILFLIGANVPIGDQDVSGLTNVRVEIVAVAQGSPAESAGLKEKDEIVSLSVPGISVKINKIADFQTFTQNNKGSVVTATVNRAGQNLNVNFTPRVDYPKGEGSVGLGLERMATLIEKVPWYQAPIKGTMYCGQVTWGAVQGIYGIFANLFSGKGVPGGAELAGPVGITIFLAKAADYGVGFFLYFIGSISVFIALFNIFPIPALDGGKFVFLIIEKVMGKPVPASWEQKITVFFFALLITASIFVTVKFDFPRVVEFWRAGL
ncbi:MAG: RIP metalloprotease [Candidatus Staskawiczbacteria bacterium]|nr:RIP metalloprotease [Candidatus Staskawiczbacteria bacterium]